MPCVYAILISIILSPLLAQHESMQVNIPSYRIEVWVFLFLVCIFIWVFYKKKSISDLSSTKNTLKHVTDEYDDAGEKKQVGVVELEELNFIDLDYKKEASLPSEKVKSKVDQKSLAKKLKNLKNKG
tara:strand:+ start:895 stop:1275 length:381 start_codon:yes stop_codon:yes gene_type:complete